MSDDKILNFQSARSPVEIILNEAEADNIDYMAIAMSTKDGDFFIMELGEEIDFISVSYFAKYFEDLRQQYLEQTGVQGEL